MRSLAVAGLGVYGVANTFAGVYALLSERGLPLHGAVLLAITGAVLLAASVGVAGRFGCAKGLVVVAIVLAAVLAVYNERVLGLGHPSHHLVRGAYSLFLVWAVWRSERAEPDSR